jgi:hypothetical protein
MNNIRKKFKWLKKGECWILIMKEKNGFYFPSAKSLIVGKFLIWTYLILLCENAGLRFRSKGIKKYFLNFINMKYWLFNMSIGSKYFHNNEKDFFNDMLIELNSKLNEKEEIKLQQYLKEKEVLKNAS